MGADRIRKRFERVRYTPALTKASAMWGRPMWFCRLLDLGEHGLPGNRIITRQQFDHALRALQPCGSVGEQVRDVLIRGIMLVAEHVYGDVLIRGGDLCHTGNGRRPYDRGWPPASRRWCHRKWPRARLRSPTGYSSQRGRRFRAIEERIMVDVPHPTTAPKTSHIQSYLSSCTPFQHSRARQTGRHLLP